jgi:uncharacterized protein YjiS (DUF1127 family)
MLLAQLESTMRANEATCFDTDRRAAALRLISAVTTTIKRFLAYRQRQADLAILCGMTERELKDVGLYRGDIDNIARARL